MLKINIGSGNVDFGIFWIHLDSIKAFHIKSNDIYLEEFDDNSVDIIYASHFIEYFDREEVVKLLNVWKNKLKKCGILRLAVPDFEVMSRLYSSGSIRLQEILGPLYGKMDSNGNIIYHKTTYDYDSLTGLLETIGFKDVKVWDWKTTEHSHIDDCSQSYLSPRADKENGVLISLNLECIK